ncbi:ABC transporter permease subunit [Miniphocaeibacter massiliensis]|uniref:ABC transporter permease subunit n=1 Tax=Miniphocaeibacter massiliensis TaxID=2041841 RepID=UPI001F5D80E1|nr:ABC transporter permease subunit [Miniphocaeibacter massiliensis]
MFRMNFKKFFSFSLVLVFLSGLFFNIPISKAETTTTEGVFRVGMEVNYAPFNWTQPNDENDAIEVSNSKGEFANGYDVQMAKKIADKLDLKLEIVKIEWDGLIPALQSGKIDAIIAGMSPTAQRKKEIDFTENYYTSDLVIVVKKEGNYAEAESIQDFKGAKITGQLSTFHYTVIDQIKGVKKQNAMDTFSTMILNTKTGKVDGYVSERPGALSATAANTDLTFVEFEKGKGFETSSEDTSIAVGLRKNSELTSKINGVLSGISEDERLDIMDKAVKLQDTVEEGKEPVKLSFWQQMKNIVTTYGTLFLSGVGNTMIIAISATLIGFLIGLLVAVVRNIQTNKKKNAFKYYIMKVINFLLASYVEIFRGTPMMVQAMLIFYGIQYAFNINTEILPTAILVVSVNTGAYLSEVVRGGINSIDNGQYEACKAIGMSHSQSMISVILPQAIKNIIPSIGNEFVINIKDTSVLNVISVTELFFMGKSVAGTTNLYFQTYIIIAIVYFVLTFTTTRILRLIEKKMFNTTSFVMESSTGGAVHGK